MTAQLLKSVNFGARSNFALGASRLFLYFSVINDFELKFERRIAKNAVALEFDVRLLVS